MDTDQRNIGEIEQLLRSSRANVQRARLLRGVCENRRAQARRLVNWARALDRIRWIRYSRAAKRALTRATATHDDPASRSFDRVDAA
jgi:hypothetical protein